MRIAVLLALLLTPAWAHAQTAPGTFAGDRAVVVIAANRRATLESIDEVTASVASIPSVWAATSYQTYRPFIVGAFGWYQVASSHACDGAYVNAAIHAAMSDGVTIDANDLVLIRWDCGHSNTTIFSSLLGRRVGVGDGKRDNFIMGLLHGLSQAAANNAPPNASNNWNPYTPMGSTGQAFGYAGSERRRMGFLTAAHEASSTSGGTVFIETLEKTPTGALKRWTSGGVAIEVRDVPNATKKPIVTLYAGGATILDLVRSTPCLQYALPLSQVFTTGNGWGVRVDSINTDRSGATVTVFRYTGSSTVTCQPGSVNK